MALFSRRCAFLLSRALSCSTNLANLSWFFSFAMRSNRIAICSLSSGVMLHLWSCSKEGKMVVCITDNEVPFVTSDHRWLVEIDKICSKPLIAKSNDWCIKVLFRGSCYATSLEDRAGTTRLDGPANVDAAVQESVLVDRARAPSLRNAERKNRASHKEVGCAGTPQLKFPSRDAVRVI